MATGHATVAGLRLAALQEMVLERNRLHSFTNINDFFHQKHRINPFFLCQRQKVFWRLHLPLDTFWTVLTSDTNSCMRWGLLQSIKKKDRRLEIISNISIYLTGCTAWMHARCIRSEIQWLNHLRDQRERWSHSFVNNCWGMFSSPLVTIRPTHLLISSISASLLELPTGLCEISQCPEKTPTCTFLQLSSVKCLNRYLVVKALVGALWCFAKSRLQL